MNEHARLPARASTLSGRRHVPQTLALLQPACLPSWQEAEQWSASGKRDWRLQVEEKHIFLLSPFLLFEVLLHINMSLIFKNF